MRKTIALLPAALLLASCGATEADEPQTVPPPPETVAPEPTFEEPEPVTLDTPQTFEFTTLEGATGVLTIPAEPEPALDQYLTLIGHPNPVSYAVVDVDNRNGAAEYGVYEVNLYTPEGETVTFYNLNNAFNDLPIEVPDTQLDAYYALPNYADHTAVGERKDEYAITEQPIPDEVARIEVTQVGGGAAQAYPEMPADALPGMSQQEWMDQQ